MVEIDTIVCGDCLDVMAEMPDGCVNLIYADMVYNDFDFSWLNECLRILRGNGSIYVQTDYRSVAEVKLYMDELFIFRNWIVWCYKACPTRKRYYQRKHDDILFYTKSDNYIWNNPTQPPSEKSMKIFKTDKDGRITNLTPSMKARSENRFLRDVVCRDWWDDISVVFARWDTGGRKQHKWQKPERLLERIIRASSNQGDLVFDPFVGSGTTAVAALKLGRHFYGCDILQECVEITNRRVEKACLEIMQTRMF